eukprot:CAMPEP_0170179076 /NCGR_PEP_ID=MMETSP0040_2-20121228/15922_1 /TAXON_ID=641309 /ORGANISM="Lotharella oceanica, Strain CCMP622" /LENGTH=243 /DNA_ID=CAMNT_0010422865 /DNA_START=343 /DNA_END=1074 /DNA_ORIENTATION=+
METRNTSNGSHAVVASESDTESKDGFVPGSTNEELSADLAQAGVVSQDNSLISEDGSTSPNSDSDTAGNDCTVGNSKLPVFAGILGDSCQPDGKIADVRVRNQSGGSAPSGRDLARGYSAGATSLTLAPLEKVANPLEERAEEKASVANSSASRSPFTYLPPESRIRVSSDHVPDPATVELESKIPVPTMRTFFHGCLSEDGNEPNIDLAGFLKPDPPTYICSHGERGQYRGEESTICLHGFD